MTPVSTYRLQLTPDFGFDQAAALVPYFECLGVTHLYLSPIWEARPGSPHGYDVCDPAAVRAELGGEQALERLVAAAEAHGVGLLLDFVPNHVAADPRQNPAWRDVLRNGPASRFAAFFDIDWTPPKPELRDKVLLPILGKQYGEVLDAGELRVAWEDGEFRLRYWEHDLPLNPRQIPLVLRHDLASLQLEMADEPELREFQSILFQLDHLPAIGENSDEAREIRAREVDVAHERLQRLLEQSAPLRNHVDRCLTAINGDPGDPVSFDALHNLLEHQAYRLSYWRTAMHEINYRRFFDINDLAAVRMEHPEVFDAWHAKAVSLLRRGAVDGLRLDHVDGLFDPEVYLRNLRAAASVDGREPYLAVEKILSETEPLDHRWPVQGTTGYDFLNRLNRLYVQPDGYQSLLRAYQAFTRRTINLDEIIYQSKRSIIRTSMASELNVLAHELNRISEKDRSHRDLTAASLRETLREITAEFPVYRTYISPRGISDADRDAIDLAIRRARERNPDMEWSVFEFVRSCLCPEPGSGPASARRLRFAMKFQQYSSPVQAKGVEDTAFYRFCPLTSMNEVGGEPGVTAASADDFHWANQRRLDEWPLSMNTTSTHDTKRGEDARARINVISEMAEVWAKGLRRWTRLTTGAKTRLGQAIAPDRNDEYLFYQTLLAVWPAKDEWRDPDFMPRVRDYMAKAVKEAKTHSSWINPSNEYDSALTHFVEQVMTGRQGKGFREAFAPFARRVVEAGARNSLSQLALKLAAPGVTDFYQGTEFWDLTLVDPDNRRAIDFSARTTWLDAWLRHVQECTSTGRPFDLPLSGPAWLEGHAKAALTALGLRARRNWPDLFLRGRYVPVTARGGARPNVIAFARLLDDDGIIAAGLRWHDTSQPLDGVLELPPRWEGSQVTNLFTNETWTAQREEPLDRLFASIPALLLRKGTI